MRRISASFFLVIAYVLFAGLQCSGGGNSPLGDGSSIAAQGEDTSGWTSPDAWTWVDSGTTASDSVVSADDAAPDTVVSVDTTTVCTPGAHTCMDQTTPGLCLPDGSAWVASEPCSAGQGCDSTNGMCRDYTCTPGTAYCANLTQLVKCSTDVTRGEETIDCAPGVCSTDHCIVEECIPAVMFLVDRSSSMSPHWAAVRSSIASVIATHPEYRYGLTAFPTAQGNCSTGTGWPDVPLSSDAGNAISQWFATQSTHISTPLLDAVTWISQNVDLVWGSSKMSAYLVVISDGEDRCGCTWWRYGTSENVQCIVDLLGPEVASLRDQGIQTFVIGYNYEGAADELNAIAANGGAPISQYISAGNEATLTQALSQSLGHMKGCNSP